MNKNTINFTVAQLIEILKTFPDDMPILVSGYESGFDNFFYPAKKLLVHQPENFWWDGQFQRAEAMESNGFEAVVLERAVNDD
nr:hypothetical protein [Bacteroidota bacterium]